MPSPVSISDFIRRLFGRVFGEGAAAEIPEPSASSPAAQSPTLPADPVERFVAGEIQTADSSNVDSAYYERDTRTLTISFKPSSSYQYFQVTEDEARSYARAGSKGSWVWDHLRIRGTKDGHKKPFVRLS